MRSLSDETTLDKRSGQLSWITGPAKFLWVAGYLDVGRKAASLQSGSVAWAKGPKQACHSAHVQLGRNLQRNVISKLSLWPARNGKRGQGFCILYWIVIQFHYNYFMYYILSILCQQAIPIAGSNHP